MKRLVAIFLAVLMVAAMMAACGGYTFPRLTGDYPAMQLDITKID